MCHSSLSYHVLVMTRSQRAPKERVDEEQRGKQMRSGVRPRLVYEVVVETADPLGEEPDDGVVNEEAMIGAEFDDYLFQSRRVRKKMTWTQKPRKE